jgi:prophage regulatory protein
MNDPTKETILRLADVIKRTGISRSALYLSIKNGHFPRPVSLGLRSVGWVESEIDLWIKDKIQSRAT